MGNIIVIFLKWILNNFFDTELDDIDINFNMGFDTLANHTLMIEKSIGLNGSTFNPEAILNYIMGFAVVLIVLKFLKKGFDTWIAWTDDPSSDPLQLTTNFGQGTCLCLDFPYIIWLVGRCYRRFNYRNNECNGDWWNDIIVRYLAFYDRYCRFYNDYFHSDIFSFDNNAIYEILDAWSGNFYCTNGISISVCRNNRCKWRCFFRICKQIISDSFVSNGAGSVV